MTAVDFLAYELMNLDIAYEMGLEKNEFHKLRQEIIKKAKEMEKEQMEDFFCTGILDSGEDYGLGFNHYYKQTFKSE
jgi:hypothetical protein